MSFFLSFLDLCLDPLRDLDLLRERDLRFLDVLLLRWRVFVLFLPLLLLLDRRLFFTGDLLLALLDDLFLSEVLLFDTGELLDPLYDPSRFRRGGESERDFFLERDLRLDLLLLRLLDLLDRLCDLLLDLDLLLLDLDLDLLLRVLDPDLDLRLLEDDLDLFLNPVPGPPGIPGPGFLRPVTPNTAVTVSLDLELDLFFLDPDLDLFRDLDLLDRDLCLERELRCLDLDLLLFLDLDRVLLLLDRDLDLDLLLPKLEASFETVLSMFRSPESAAAVMRDWASFTFFMASSISLCAASCILDRGFSMAEVEWATFRGLPWNMTPL